MTEPVFVVEGSALADDTVELTGDEAHHAVAVRRLRVGERVRLTDGAGQGAECVVVAVERRRLTAEVRHRRSEPSPNPRLVVVQGLLKSDGGERAVDLMAQVGVDAVVPWAAARSLVSWRTEPGDRSEKALQKWRSAAREASKQSGRLRFPSVETLHSTTEVAGLLSTVGAALVLHEAAETPLSDLTVPGDGDLAMVVGPEGGLTDEEVRTFAAAGALAVRLGPSVLRASAAGAVAAGVVLSRTARWQ